MSTAGEKYGRCQELAESSEVYYVLFQIIHPTVTILTSVASDGVDLGMLIGLRSVPELAVHTTGAINNGLTEVQRSGSSSGGMLRGAGWERGHADLREDDQ